MFHNDSLLVNTNSTSSQPSGLIADNVGRLVNLGFNLAWLLIIVPGLWANALIIRTFHRMGNKDGVSLCFVSLAICDISTLLGPIANLVLAIVLLLHDYGGLFLHFDLRGFAIYITLFAVTFNRVAVLITTFLAVQRALCIMRPFQFRGTMTQKKTLIYVIVCSILNLAASVSYGSGINYKRFLIDPSTNTTKYITTVTSYFKAMKLYLVIITQIVFFIICKVLIFGSLIVMIYGMKASTSFRQTATTSGDSEVEAKDTQKSSKERAVIAQVALLSAFFLIFNLPKFSMSLVEWILPEFAINGRLHFIFTMAMAIRLTFEYLNTIVNFPIYYKYNTAFRKLCFVSRKEKN